MWFKKLGHIQKGLLFSQQKAPNPLGLKPKGYPTKFPNP